METCRQKGQVIPDFIYLVATNHDQHTLLKFLVSIQPEKKQYALELSVAQGAICCFEALAQTVGKADLESLMTRSLHIRRNEEAMRSLILATIIAKDSCETGYTLSS